MSSLFEIAKKSLENNCVESTSGPVTVAGGHQFKTYWVRDFCYSVPGLLLLGHADQVRGQIEIALKNQREDGLIARGFDVIDPKTRVLARTFGIPASGWASYEGRPLKAEFLGEHRTPAVDSNLLITLVALQWTEDTGDFFFWNRYSREFEKAFQFLLIAREGGLLTQPGFSDWQDSARREGRTFYLNLLFIRVLERLQKHGIAWSRGEDLAAWKKRVFSEFFDAEVGLFRSQPGRAQYSLETQLWAIEDDVFASEIDRSVLYANLKKSSLWFGGLPGVPVAPFYPKQDVSWTTKAVGLRHYHDNFHWSWLMGETLKVARLMKDEETFARISTELQKLADEHGVIHEVYELKTRLVPVKRFLYRSEYPFSWGAAKIIEGLGGNGG